jgi:hypothetical protein
MTALTDVMALPLALKTMVATVLVAIVLLMVVIVLDMVVIVLIMVAIVLDMMAMDMAEDAGAGTGDNQACWGSTRSGR